MLKHKRGLTTTQIIMTGFLITILVGAFLLMLPISSRKGEITPFIDSLFTSTTSVCVTGLVTVPTYLHWNIFGQVVIMLLIQVGGLGIITFTTIVLLVMGKRISLKERMLIQDAYNIDTLRGVVKLTMRIVKGTAIVEAVGALLYMIVFVPDYGVKGIWISIFTSISGFCNAGIDLLGDFSLQPYQSNVIVNVTTMLLIIFGGIGFPVWWNIVDVMKQRKTKYNGVRQAAHHFRLHTKVVLASTAILIVAGAVLILLMECHNDKTLGTLSWPVKILASLFQSVTNRTAGFFTFSQGGMRTCTAFICILMMFIGGSPSGTAGGIKTTTFSIILLAVYSVVRGRKDTEAFGRKISTILVKKAMAIMVVSFSVLAISVIALSMVENKSLIDLLYESTSAIGTVGLTRGITPDLTVAGKIIIIITMYAGRVGPISLALFFNSRKYVNARSYPAEGIGVG